MSTSPPVEVFVEAPVTFGPGLVEGPARTLGRQDDAKENDDKGRDRWAIASRARSGISASALWNRADPSSLGSVMTICEWARRIIRPDDNAVGRTSGAHAPGRGGR
jgi:hypothetical protein